MAKFNYEINKLKYDEFGRPSGIILHDKKKGETSHDVVASYRRSLGLKAVGHAGTLDPFATGALIILVGKATKMSDSFLGLDKEYEATMLLGVSTETFDIEGSLSESSNNKIIKEDDFRKALKNFEGEQKQYVPVFSSVKVEGNKLRVLARSSESFEIQDDEDSKFIIFHKGKSEKKVKLPSKNIKLYNLELIDFKDIKKEMLKDYFSKENFENLKSKKYQIAKIRVYCSKGTYIRQLAHDIGNFLKTDAILIELRRTKISDLQSLGQSSFF